MELLHIFKDPAPRPVDVGAILEDDEYVGIIEHGLRANRFDVRRSQHCRNDWVGDLILDDVGRLSHPLGVYNHLNVRDIGKRVERDQIY